MQQPLSDMCYLSDHVFLLYNRHLFLNDNCVGNTYFPSMSPLIILSVAILEVLLVRTTRSGYFRPNDGDVTYKPRPFRYFRLRMF